MGKRKNMRYVIKTVKIPPQIANLMSFACRQLGLSESEFMRQAIIEKLERLSLVSTKVKEGVVNA